MQIFKRGLCHLIGCSKITIAEGDYYCCARCGEILGNIKMINRLMPIIIYKDGHLYCNFAYEKDVFDGKNHSSSFKDYIGYYFNERELWLVDKKIVKRMKFLFERHEALPPKDL